jgi:hypothetical protein
MKKLDRIFLVLLIILPLITAVVVVMFLSRTEDVSPEDTSAREVQTGDETYSIQPVATSTATPTPTRIITQEQQSPNYIIADSISEDSYQDQTEEDPEEELPGAENTAPALPLTDNSDNPEDVSGKMPDSEEEMENETKSIISQSSGLDTTNILLFSGVVALVFGGLIIAGILLRRKKT